MVITVTGKRNLVETGMLYEIMRKHIGLAIIFNMKTGGLFKNSNGSDNGKGKLYKQNTNELLRYIG